MGKLLGIALLSALFFKGYNKINSFVKLQKRKNLLHQAQLKKQKDYLKSLKGGNPAVHFSICLSLDYKVKRNFSAENKAVINKVIFSKISNMLKNIMPELKIYNTQDSFIITSNDFESYDKVYSSLLKILSKIKSEVDERYDINMIPSITTDAHSIQPDIDTVKQTHVNIKHCSLSGSSCSTDAFAKKYECINKNKYIGKPIGEYSIVDKEKTNTYELNMINQNLSKQLESLGQ